jgi:hypothetical protein
MTAPVTRGHDATGSGSALDVRRTVAAAARTGTRHRRRILTAAVAVCIITALAETVVDDAADRAYRAVKPLPTTEDITPEV